MNKALSYTHLVEAQNLQVAAQKSRRLSREKSFCRSSAQCLKRRCWDAAKYAAYCHILWRAIMVNLYF